MDKRLDALLKGYSQGGSFGTSDELSGAIGTGLDKVLGLSDQNKKLKDQGFTGDIGPTSSSEVYKQDRDQYRKSIKDLADQHPVYFNAGDLIGGAMTSLPGTSSMLKAGTLGAAKLGALTGAAHGLGRSDSDNVGDMAVDTAIGAGIGGLGGAALSKGAETVYDKAQQLNRNVFLPKKNLQLQENANRILNNLKSQQNNIEQTGEGYLLRDSNSPDYQHFIKQLADEDLVKEQQALGQKMSEHLQTVYAPSSSIDEATAISNSDQSNVLKDALKKFGR